MSKPEKFGDYERVRIDDFVKGVIEEVQEEPEHAFPVFKKMGEKYVKAGENVFFGVRMKYKLEGCEYPHFSRWMKFTYGERSNLFTKYLTNLVKDAKPEMDFDIQALKGLEVKTLWDDNKFQGLITIMPLKGKIVSNIEAQEVSGVANEEPPVGEEETEVPF